MDNDLLSGSEIAHVLGVGRNALYAMLRRKRIWDGGNSPRDEYRQYFCVKQKQKNGYDCTVFRPQHFGLTKKEIDHIEKTIKSLS